MVYIYFNLTSYKWMFYISIFIFYMIKIVKADKWDNLKMFQSKTHPIPVN